jgi:hypothetical protein
MEVKKLLEQITADELAVAEDLGGWDPRTVIGKQMAKRQAEDRLGGLRAEYKKAVAEAAVGIVLEGSVETQADFAALAEDEASTITVNANEMYLTIAKKVLPSLGRDQLFTATQSGLMFEAIEEIATNVEAPLALTAPIGTPPFSHVFSEQECANLIRSVIRKAIGESLNALYLEKQVVEKALSVRYNSNVVPVVITNAVPEEVDGLVKALFAGRNFPVKLTGNITKDSVLKTLLQIKKKINPKTNN